MSIPFFYAATVFSRHLIAASGTALEAARFSVVSPRSERRYADFRDAFQKNYGTLPVLDTANLIVGFTNQFKGEVGSASYNDELQSLLSSVNNCDGASGKIATDHDGGTRSLVVRTYEVKQGTRPLSNLQK